MWYGLNMILRTMVSPYRYQSTIPQVIRLFPFSHVSGAIAHLSDRDLSHRVRAGKLSEGLTDFAPKDGTLCGLSK
jgi:hypothetical protein